MLSACVFRDDYWPHWLQEANLQTYVYASTLGGDCCLVHSEYFGKGRRHHEGVYTT